jgi:two-component system response regulator GlrR
LFLLTDKNTAEIEKLLSSKNFKEFRKPSIICAKNIAPENLIKFFSLGIDNYAVAPFKEEDILLKICRLADKDFLRKRLLIKAKEKIGLQKIIGKNPEFIGEINKLPLIAKFDVCVLLTGETGTGKEIIARAIHYLSPRAGKPFVPVNCGAIPNDLVENELFGHEKGAFTSALVSEKGLVREADGGTLFLDEIDSLPLISQVKLLRFLQDKEFRSLGSAKTQTADVRIIAASNHDLEELVKNNNIRSDLYYRLNVMQISLPPLRRRTEDISLLSYHFIEKYSAEFNKKVVSIEPDALLKLQNYEWRGNVRELENIIERAVLLCEGDQITTSLLKTGNVENEPAEESFSAAKKKVVARFEKHYLKKVLETYHGNITKAAEAAGKNRRAFFELIRKHHINVEKFKS